MVARTADGSAAKRVAMSEQMLVGLKAGERAGCLVEQKVAPRAVRTAVPLGGQRAAPRVGY